MEKDQNDGSRMGSSDVTRCQIVIYCNRGMVNQKTIQDGEWIRLNVGGKLFTTTRFTLRKDPESFLFRLCQENSGLVSQKDDMGAYLVDRDLVILVLFSITYGMDNL